MIQRRQFFGTLSACMAAGWAGVTFGECFAASAPSSDLKWHCDVIPTVAHNRADRRPVVTGVCLQPAGPLLAIVGDDHHVSLYDTRQRKYSTHFAAHSDWVRAAKFTPDGKMLVTAGNDRTIKAWDTGNWRLPKYSREHNAAIIEVDISSDGSKLATVGFETGLKVYDLNLGRKITELNCPCNDNHAVAFSPDGKLIAAGGRCGTITVWDLNSESHIVQQKLHRKRIRSVQFTADGKVVSGSDDQTVSLLDPQNPAFPRVMPRLASKLYAVELINNNLIATGGSDNRIHIWQSGNERLLGTLGGHTGTVSCLDYSDGKLASGSYDTHVRLWHAERLTQLPNEPNQFGEWNPRLK